MKKPYSKPLLFAEKFELLEHIAGDCSVNDGFAGAMIRKASECAYVDDNLNLFMDGVTHGTCDTSLFDSWGLTPSVENLPAIGVECYNAFLGTAQLFAS